MLSQNFGRTGVTSGDGGARRNYSLLVTDSGGPDSRNYQKEK